jgi:hypothetical protein
VVVLVVVVVIVLVVGVVAGGFWLGAREKQNTDGQTFGRGVDDPRGEPITGEGATGGKLGEALAAALKVEKYACTNTPGEGDTAVLSCFQNVEKPTRNTQRIVAEINGDELVSVDATVDADPAMRRLEEADTVTRYRPDVRLAAAKLFGVILAAVVPDGERPAVEKAMAESSKQTKRQELDTSPGKVSVLMGREGSTFSLEAGTDTPDAVTIRPGLTFVTAAELEKASSGAGLTCERTTDSMTCTSGKVELTVTYPRPDRPGVDHDVQSVRLTGPAEPSGSAPPELRKAASEITSVLAGKYGDQMAATSWASNCFKAYTQQLDVAASTLSCSPEMVGKVGSPRVERYVFQIGAIER